MRFLHSIWFFGGAPRSPKTDICPAVYKSSARIKTSKQSQREFLIPFSGYLSLSMSAVTVYLFVVLLHTDVHTYIYIYIFFLSLLLQSLVRFFRSFDVLPCSLPPYLEYIPLSLKRKKSLLNQHHCVRPECTGYRVYR